MRHQQRESDPRTRMPTASRSPTHRPARQRSYSSNPGQAGGPALGRIGPPPAHQPSSSHEIPERHSGDISCAAMRDFPPAQRRMVLNCNPRPRASSLVPEGFQPRSDQYARLRSSAVQGRPKRRKIVRRDGSRMAPLLPRPPLPARPARLRSPRESRSRPGTGWQALLTGAQRPDELLLVHG